MYDPAAYLERGEVQALGRAKNGRPRINIPTAVVYGISDQRKGESEALVAVCDSEKTFVSVYEGGNEIPGIGVKGGFPVSRLPAEQLYVLRSMSNGNSILYARKNTTQHFFGDNSTNSQYLTLRPVTINPPIS